MNVHEDVLSAHLEGEAVLLHLGTKRYYRVNETGAAILEGLEEGRAPEAIADDLAARFDVERTEALRAVRTFVEDLERAEILEPPSGEQEGDGCEARD